MKTLKHILLAAAAVLVFALPSNAQFKFGPRVGINVNSLHFNKELVNTDNRTGFNAGLQAQFTVPVLGLGLDASLMYVRRNTEIGKDKNHSDYFEIPVNVRCGFCIPVISKIVKPYIFTGPSFAFLTSKRAITDAYKSKSVDTSWNGGLGLEFFSHLQVSAYYGIGLNKAVKGADSIEGKTHCWTVTAAWMF